MRRDRGERELEAVEHEREHLQRNLGGWQAAVEALTGAADKAAADGIPVGEPAA